MPRCRNNYRLPVQKGDIQDWSKRKSPAHTGRLRHSIDFFCEEETPIYASLEGEVAWLKEDSNEGGPQKKYWDKGNRIVLKHANQEYTAYEHLRYRGMVVELGQQVRTGQLIGYSGNTGWSNSPHLHFEVFTNPDRDESEGTTLQVTFKELRRK